MWDKKGLLFQVNQHQTEELTSHASIPFALHLEEDDFRIYFSSRNSNGKSLPYFIDAHVKDGIIQTKGSANGPLLELGSLGTFDDSGIMPSSIVRYEGKIYMYYIGWNPQITVSYRLSIGLAISQDNGKTFRRYSQGPICDRTANEPYFNTAPYVIRENDIWRMWYISCTKWQKINDYPEPSYHIKYAESTDGVHWNKEGIVCVDYDEIAQALGRPSVIVNKTFYQMYFSYRKVEEYRTSDKNGYKLGLAESTDGIIWTKKYDQVGITLSDEGWDNKMMEYCHVFSHNGIRYMLYNGNDFGKDGFGYAVEQ
jgi:hypothetical protein